MKNHSIHITQILTVLLMLNLICVVPTTVWAASSSEVSEYLEMLKSPYSRNRSDASKMVFRSGLKSPEIFEMVNSILLKEYKNAPRDRQAIDELAWHCKVLSISGNEKYKDSLKEIINNAENSKLRKHAAKSLKSLDVNVKRNNIKQDAGLSREEADLILMLRAKNHVRKIIASKKITHMEIENEKFFDIVNEILLEEYNKIPNEYEEDDYGVETMPMQSFGETVHHDAVAWLCKALASSKMPKYKKTLHMISKESIYPKLRKYAKESMARLN